MYTVQQLSDGLYWVGGNDRRLALFENMFPLPNGVVYNSYVIVDEKVAIMDTVDSSILRSFLENVDGARNGRPVDYLVIHHMEPDHCAGILELARLFPEMTLVGNAKTFQFIRQFYPGIMLPKTMEVKDGETLSLGRRKLTFLTTPMVHWPEVMMSYEETEGILFSADAFGAFGALSGNLFADQVGFDEVFLSEARRYYSNIVGKYGQQVQLALKKLQGRQVNLLCPLHGPIWRKDVARYIGLYDTWSSYRPEQKGVMLAYGSMYGNTADAAEIVAARLSQRGISNLRLYDISKTHHSYLIADIFRFSHLVLAAPTYNNGLYPGMETVLHDMAALNIQNRKVALIGNGTWSPVSAKIMAERLAAMKNMTLVAEPVVLKSAVNDETLPALKALADKIAESLEQEQI